MTHSNSASIPVVDFAGWSAGNSEEKQRIAKEITDASRTVGFVYVRNHGVPEKLLAEAFSWSKKLFDLPQEKKMLAPHPPGYAIHRGYSWPGLEKVSQYIHQEGSDALAEDTELRKVADVKESYEIGSETNPSQPNIWLPDPILPGFRAFMTAFYATAFETARELLHALVLGLGLQDETSLDGYHRGGNGQLRLLHYPPVDARELEGGSAARMPAHTDWGTLTLLFQDGVGGLQVKGVEGEFVDARPVEGALVMNVGDLLMRWTNDLLRSTMHRVTLPPAIVKEAERTGLTPARYSIPFFFSPEMDTVVECLPSCMGEGNPAKYPPILFKDYVMLRGKLQYPEESVERDRAS